MVAANENPAKRIMNKNVNDLIKPPLKANLLSY
jgi:hypothetical protein